jgi:hypothetical protein
MNSHDDAKTVKAAFRNPVRRFHWVLLVGLGLGFAVLTSAVDKKYFIGHWMNANKVTRGIIAMEIGEQDGQTLMRAWGACTPRPCKWGQTKVSFLAPNVSSQDVRAATAVFRTKFEITRLTMRPGKRGTITVEVMTHFTDNSGRSDYTSTESFRSVPWQRWDSNTFN